jgi:type IX secretion system PorP/SprF family membrane protein
MKKLLLKYYLLFIAIFIAVNSFGQDIHFSQIFETPLLRNPALTGLFKGDLRMQTVYRSQWNTITNAYQTVSANVEYKIPRGENGDFVTLGSQVLYDKAGSIDLTSLHFLPALNYHKSLNNDKSSYLSFAMMGGFVQRSLDRSKITTNNQFNGSSYDGTIATGETFTKSAYSYMDATVGMSYSTQLGDNEDNNMYIGLAYHHFNKSKKLSFYSDYNLEMTPKWTTSAGVRMSTSDNTYITFEGDYNKQGVNTEFIGGILYSMKLGEYENPKYVIHAGSYMRLKDAIIPVVKIETNPLGFAMSYDVNISNLKKVSRGRGGFEFSITYQKFLDKYNSSINSTKCPKF